MSETNSPQKRAIAYSLLAHIRTSGSFAGGPLDIFAPIVKNILHEVFADGTSSKGESLQELGDAIFERYNLAIPIPVLRNILVKIKDEVNAASGKEDIRIFNDGGFWIEKYIFEDYKDEVRKSKEDIITVQKLFKEFCKIYNVESSNDENAIFRFIEQNKSDISYYLSHTDKSTEAGNTIAAQFIDVFKNNPVIFDKIKDIYLGSLLTGYLSFQPKDVQMGVELVLDTNFLVSLLDLNTEESTRTCNMLIEVGQRLGYNFTVLNETIEEMQGLLAFKAENLDKAIIAKSINREDIYNACDRRNLNSVDLERISDNLTSILTDKYNFKIIPHTESWHGKARFSHEYTKLKTVRSSDKAAFHDALAIAYVKDKRGGKIITEFDKVNCWFVNNAISHDCDNDLTNLVDGTSANTRQPEIIKVDALLNILWLSSPSIGVQGQDVVDMGISAMISYTLNSSLPKSRIIKELDDNIQKYRAEYDITDTDVVRLSTRIANRQINDLQSINELARRDQVAFVARVKEEVAKQDKIEEERAVKLEELMSLMQETISELRSNKGRLDQKHSERMEELDTREKMLEQKDSEILKRELAIKSQQIEENSQITALTDENKTKDSIIQKLWNKENAKRDDARKVYVDTEIKKWRRCALLYFIFGIMFFVISAVVAIFVYCCSEICGSEIVNQLQNNKILTIILPSIFGVVNLFTIHHYYNCKKNPSYETSKRSLIEKEIPAELRYISIDEYTAL